MIGLSTSIIGAGAALVSAFAWALGPVLFKKLGNQVHPLGMNLGRGILGIICLGLLALIFGIEPVTNRALLFLGISGLLGITLGDTFFFMGLVRLGARLTVLMGTLCPVITVFLAVTLLKERPAFIVWVGICLTIAGVVWVLWERAPRKALKQNWASGIKFGLLSVLCTAIGIIFAKIGVASVSPLQATFIRLSFGTLGLILWGAWSVKLTSWLSPFKDFKLLTILFSAVVIGVCVGLLFSIIALKYADASIAVPLNSTSPLFVLPLSVFIFKEKISARAGLGAFIAVCGIIMIFLHS